MAVAAAWSLVVACSTLGGSDSGKRKPQVVDSTPGRCDGCADALGPGGAPGEGTLGGGGGAAGEPELGQGGLDAGASDADLPPLCEPSDAGPPPLRDPLCPLEKPVASACYDEGLDCLYESDTEGCFEPWTCLFGIWSPLPRTCRARLDGSSNNSNECPALVPVSQEPCEPEGLECEYGTCEFTGLSTRRVTCVCGRFRIERFECVPPAE